MGNHYLTWVSIGYAALAATICAVEVKRTRKSGPDVLSVFMAIFLLQCCLPGIIIFGCLRLTGFQEPTGNPVFDRIFGTMEPSSAWLVLGMTAWFAMLIYVFMAAGGHAVRRILPGPRSGNWIMLRGSPSRLLFILSCGLALTLVSFWLMGDTLFGRYAALIALRAESAEFQSQRLAEFTFLLTQTWIWLSVVALFVIFERRGRALTWYFCLVCLVIFSALGVSRRAIFIPLLLAYLTVVLFEGRWRIKFILAASIPILLWVAYGKDALSAVAYGGSVEVVVGRYDTFAQAILRAASDIGITLVESVGTIGLLHIPPRFGVDHLLSIVNGAPIGWFLHWAGQDDGMPQRVVRLSTQAFARSDWDDIPPGLFGQMWLDFRLLGPIIWAFGFALQLSIVQLVFSWVVRTQAASAALVLATFVIALPLNSGSYDFTFTSDILALVLCLLFSFKAMRVTIQMDVHK